MLRHPSARSCEACLPVLAGTPSAGRANGAGCLGFGRGYFSKEPLSLKAISSAGTNPALTDALLSLILATEQRTVVLCVGGEASLTRETANHSLLLSDPRSSRPVEGSTNDLDGRCRSTIWMQAIDTNSTTRYIRSLTSNAQHWLGGVV